MLHQIESDKRIQNAFFSSDRIRYIFFFAAYKWTQ
jgi:hypothetical protein